MIPTQRTIKKVVEFCGNGLFTGERVCLRLNPDAANTGIKFVRTDLPNRPIIPASVGFLSNHLRRIMLKKNGAEVQCIEHLMAALSGMGIDNLSIELDGREIPAGDGSSKIFTELIKDAGTLEQDEPKRTFTVVHPITVNKGDASISALPYDKGFLLSYVLDFNGAFLHNQCYNIELNDVNFGEEIAPARTFILSKYIEEFRKLGLGKGVTDDNSLVVHEDGRITKPLSMTPAQLRFPDECIRHKVLDLIGDLYLTNVTLRGHIVAFKSGHALNTLMAEKIARVVQ
ncbi:MAG TPA: UDP-3-O-acyl-N-acetylglucosamine deacetylase [Candidatus Brocadiales bacterium]|nr:UDP-3-O-acyl-N-acetylglucosamine deacetylase [Candidatus Brocadiales bacterium]